MKQPEVASNLDYLVQVGWVREVTKERSFKTGKGMEISAEQVKYKISDIGINHLEAASVFKKPETAALAEAARIAAQATEPSADRRGAVEYKREMARVLTGRALKKAVERAGGK